MSKVDLTNLPKILEITKMPNGIHVLYCRKNYITQAGTPEELLDFLEKNPRLVEKAAEYEEMEKK